MGKRLTRATIRKVFAFPLKRGVTCRQPFGRR